NLTHLATGSVGDVDVCPGSIHQNALRRVQGRFGSRTTVAADARDAGLGAIVVDGESSNNRVNRAIVTDFTDDLVAGGGDVQVAYRVPGNAGVSVQLCPGRQSAVTGETG